MTLFVALALASLVATICAVSWISWAYIKVCRWVIDDCELRLRKDKESIKKLASIIEILAHSASEEDLKRAGFSSLLEQEEALKQDKAIH